MIFLMDKMYIVLCYGAALIAFIELIKLLELIRVAIKRDLQESKKKKRIDFND